MDLTELGIVKEVRPLQTAKALFPMDVTELGMVMEVRLLHPWYLQTALFQLFTC